MFSNVSKGQLATKSDLIRDFDTEEVDNVILTVGLCLILFILDLDIKRW